MRPTVRLMLFTPSIVMLSTSGLLSNSHYSGVAGRSSFPVSSSSSSSSLDDVSSSLIRLQISTWPIRKDADSTRLYGAKQKQAAGEGPATHIRQAKHEKWQPHFVALTAYQQEHGHCLVTEDENPSLYEWVQDQHKSYRSLKMGRKSKMTRKRAVALELLGAIPAELVH